MIVMSDRPWLLMGSYIAFSVNTLCQKREKERIDYGFGLLRLAEEGKDIRHDKRTH